MTKTTKRDSSKFVFCSYIVALLYLNQLIFGCSANETPRLNRNQLNKKIVELQGNVEVLEETIRNLETTVKQNIAEQNVDKTITSLVANSSAEASNFWKKVVAHSISSNHTGSYLETIISTSFSQCPSCYLTILQFLHQNQLYQGYPYFHTALLRENYEHDSEILFRLGHQILSNCGIGTKLFETFPEPLRILLTQTFSLQNVHNRGYLIAEDYLPCLTPQECFQKPQENVFLFKVYRDQLSEKVTENTRAHWKIVPSDLNSHGVYLKNVAHDAFLIAKVYMSGYFLRRDNITFPQYYEKELQSLYEFELHQDEEVNNEQSLRIGIMEKRSPRKSYMYGHDFNKDMKISAQRRGGYTKKGLEWIVTPVGTNSQFYNSHLSLKCEF